MSLRCDGATQRDESGFNKLDAKFGRDLSYRDSLTDKQAHAAAKMLLKYKRQINENLYKIVEEVGRS